MSMKNVAEWALNIAEQRGATYADVRIVDDRQRTLATKNGKVGHAASSDSLGVGVRVIVNDSWGFASSDDLRRESVERTATKAVEIAKASARVKEHPVRLAPEGAAKVEWATPCKIDPFTTSVEQNLDLLTRIDKELLSVQGVTLAESSLHMGRYEQWFYSSEGSDIHQTRYVTGSGFVAYSFAGTEIQKRSYPNSFGGQYQSKGYELIDELKLLENARRIGEQAVALHKAEQCPQGKMTVVLDSSQLGLQIHESIGHPIELDRVLGMEANFAGTSFLTLDKLRTLRYGSDIVNVVADATEQHGP
ncbi:MAG TPA: TldD/PmbA family protein, partial [Candidatus Acidoferrales bacterium]|nr:TldD/PmbA family protein [Candidatus Acidoferrales bacterium]